MISIVKLVVNTYKRVYGRNSTQEIKTTDLTCKTIEILTDGHNNILIVRICMCKLSLLYG